MRAVFSCKPLENRVGGRDMMVSLAGTRYRKLYADGAISDLAASEPSRDVGREIDLYISWKVSSDVSANVVVGQFSPGGAYPAAVPLGIVLGLVLGKPVGIGLFSWLAVRSGRASLPEGVTWSQIMGAGLLAGVGFTMSLFISELAFGDPALVAGAKIGILGASVIAGVGGWLLIRLTSKG